MEINTLDIKQLKIIESFINGENIFMSGPAGTGKSYLIKIIHLFPINFWSFRNIYHFIDLFFFKDFFILY